MYTFAHMSMGMGATLVSRTPVVLYSKELTVIPGLKPVASGATCAHALVANSKAAAKAIFVIFIGNFPFLNYKIQQTSVSVCIWFGTRGRQNQDPTSDLLTRKKFFRALQIFC